MSACGRTLIIPERVEHKAMDFDHNDFSDYSGGSSEARSRLDQEKDRLIAAEKRRYNERAKSRKKERKRQLVKKIILTVIIVIAVAAVAAVIYYLATRKTGDDETGYSVTTKQFAFNNVSYVSKIPVFKRGEHYYFPVKEAAKALGFQCSVKEDKKQADISFRQQKFVLNLKDGVVTYQGQPLLYTSAFAKLRGNIYVSDELLKNNCGVHIHNNGTQSTIYLDTFEQHFDYSWAQNTSFIAHAGGGIDGSVYTNSREAWDNSLKEGFRVLEADFAFTTDGKLVSVHDWTKGFFKKYLGIDKPDSDPMSYSEFMNLKLCGKYTPLSFEDVARIMKKHTDVYLVLDFKDYDAASMTSEYKALVDEASKVDSSVLDRMIPQIYNEESYDAVMSVYQWKSLIYTLYQLPNPLDTIEILQFSYSHDIDVITTDLDHGNDMFWHELSDRGIMSYLHTGGFNDVPLDVLQRGAKGIYSNFVLPDGTTQAR